MAAFLKKVCSNITYSSISHIFRVRSLQRTTQYLSLQHYATDEPQNVREILKELEENEEKLKYSEEEIDKMRNVSRLSPYLRDILHQNIPDLTQDKFNYVTVQRKIYAKHGKASGIDPKLCWPSKSKMVETMNDDAILERPLEQVLMKAFMKADRDADKKIKKVEEIDENMNKMRKLISDYRAKVRKHRAIRRQTRRRRMEVTDIVREHYGYNMQKTDHKSRALAKQKSSEKMKAYRDIKADIKARKNVKKAKIKEEKRASKLKETQPAEISDTP